MEQLERLDLDLLGSLSAHVQGLLDDPELLRLAFVIGLGLLIFVLSLAVAALVRAYQDPVQRRVEAFTPGRGGGQRGGVRSGAKHAERMLERLGRGLTPVDPQKRGKIETKLVQAGSRSSRAVSFFFAAKIVGLVVLPAAVLLGLTVIGGMPQATVLALSGVALAIGMLLPDAWLARKVRQRQNLLRRSLPDALDLLVVCAEAGLGLNGAIQRVAQEIEAQHPELSRELATVMAQTRAGVDTRTALQDMVERTGLDEMRALVGTLIQALRFGTSVAETLRLFSDEMRDKRIKAAEEQAAKVSVKMLVPIGLFMIPAFLIIAVGPPLIRLGKSIGGLAD